MTYDARDIANWFVARAQRDDKVLSIMSLLKLAYIAHGWHLEMRDTPLFNNRIEAWRYGPVIPDIYDAYREHQRQGVNVAKAVAAPGQQISESDEHLLEQVYNNYGTLQAFQLSDLTHVSGGPWDIAIKVGGTYAPIPDALVRQHYVQKRTMVNEESKRD